MSVQKNKTSPLILIILAFIGVWVINKAYNKMFHSSETKSVTPTYEKAYHDEIEKISTAKKLAIIDEKGYVKDDDIKITRIDYLLKSLSGKYKETEESIADATSRAQQVLKDNGIIESNLSILEQMNKTNVLENTKYIEAVTLYATLKSQ